MFLSIVFKVINVVILLSNVWVYKIMLNFYDDIWMNIHMKIRIRRLNVILESINATRYQGSTSV